MFTFKKVLLVFGVIAYSSYASCFFLNWGDSSNTDTRGVPAYYYTQRFTPQLPYTTRNEPVPPAQIPAIPIQLPLQAAFSSLSNVHNVQLVPCLCPVSPETDNNKEDERSAILNHIKNSRLQDQ